MSSLSWKKVIFSSLCILFFLYMTNPINPIHTGMYNFHDETQLARVSQFVLNIRHLNFPPRLAPDVSFGLGFPLFNFYAPASYWITSAFVILGFSEVFALKLSFFLAIGTAFLGMHALLRKLFNFHSSWLGATVYVSATYFATEVVIRGNLAETWFLALLPLSLFFLIENSKSVSKQKMFISAVFISLLFTAHNIFSLLAVPLLVIFSLFFSQKRQNLTTLFIAFLLGSYFIIPSLFETHLTDIAKHITEYNYKGHFLCVWQLWKSSGWNFGPSLPGCEGDQMSFKIGKMQLLLGMLGILWLFITSVKKRDNTKPNWFLLVIALFTLLSLFLTLYQSAFIWNSFSQTMSLFQFPWRFVLFGMFGLGILSAYFFDNIKIPLKPLVILVVIAVCFTFGKKYFIKPLFSNIEYNKKYNSKEYIQRKMAYMMPEYISPHADYNYWWTLKEKMGESLEHDFDFPIVAKQKFQVIENTQFNKSVYIKKPETITVNVQDFPYWNYFVNNERVFPTHVDKLGRPQLNIQSDSYVDIRYSQTPVEKLGNTLSFSTFALFVMYLLRKKLKDPFPVYLFSVLVPLFLYRVFTSFRMPPSYNYDSDFGRDLLRMFEILHGKLTLIGPQLSFAGLHMAPYSYYLFAPFLFIGRFDYRFVVLANALFFLTCAMMFYLIIKRKFGNIYSFLSTLWLFSTPYIILSTRSPGNAFSYIPLFIGVVTLFLVSKKMRTRTHCVIALLEGVIINFHPANVIILFPIHLISIIAAQKTVRQKIRNSIVMIISVASTFLPVLLFDLRHNFVIVKSVFNFGNMHHLEKPGFLSLNAQTSSLISLTLIGLLLLVLLSFLADRKQPNRFFFYVLVGIGNVLVLFLLGEGAIHYFFPTLLFFQIFFIFLNSNAKIRNGIVILLILINVVSFPIRLFTPSRNLSQIDSLFVEAKDMLKLPNASLNVALINDTYLSRVGYEYRFLLKKYGYVPDDEYSYATSLFLLLVSEKGDINWKKEKSWELDQFGAKREIRKIQSGVITFYLFEKQK